jgi:hypothetical protein
MGSEGKALTLLFEHRLEQNSLFFQTVFEQVLGFVKVLLHVLHDFVGAGFFILQLYHTSCATWTES